MPYTKIQTSPLSGGNSGSCGAMVKYLEKENEEGISKEWFFDKHGNPVHAQQVVREIDSNKAKLSKGDAKFYSIIIAPSEKELEVIGGNHASQSAALKGFTKKVMDEYARNFKRDNVKSAEDLLYFAKIEYQREFKGTDQQVREGHAKAGEVKPGNQMHIHVIVSRKDATNKVKLSPLSNHRSTKKGPIKGGFDRTRFKEAVEWSFDEKFQYERPLEECFNYMNTMANGSFKEICEMLDHKHNKYRMMLHHEKEQQRELNKASYVAVKSLRQGNIYGAVEAIRNMDQVTPELHEVLKDVSLYQDGVITREDAEVIQKEMDNLSKGLYEPREFIQDYKFQTREEKRAFEQGRDLGNTRGKSKGNE